MPFAEAVERKLETLPTQPGVYVFRSASNEVLYVGKARSLRSRVRSYFQPGSSDVRAFVARLEAELADIETFVTATEKEAALLENQLIKAHQPRYNVKLRDDKEFLSLRLSPKAEWPRLEVVRRPRPDGAHYFGPYHSASSARQTLRLVNRHFQLRTCTDAELKNRARACLQYQIKRCPGPCVHPVDREEYALQVRSVARFLGGRHDELVEELEQRMKDASASLEFERAALYRDQLRAVERVREDQRVTAVKDVDQDVIGYFRQADQAEVAVLLVRGGRLVGVRTYDLKRVALPDDELVASFLVQWYARSPVPDEIILPLPVEAMDGLAEVLGESRAARGQKPPRVVVPNRQAKRKLVEMAMDNAAHAFREKRLAEDDIEARLAQVQRRLRLPSLPRRIECIDVSHHGGDDAVAAVVTLRDGAPDKKGYRSFRVRRAKAGDDYGAMYEVLSRRFRRGRDGEVGWELPDLFVVDGGKGQLNVALAVLRDLGVRTADGGPLPVVGLAKEREVSRARRTRATRNAKVPSAATPTQHGAQDAGPITPAEAALDGAALDDAALDDAALSDTTSDAAALDDAALSDTTSDAAALAGRLVDRVYLPGAKNAIPVSSSPALQMLAHARDEAHRFSNAVRARGGTKRRFHSALDDVPGVGARTRQKLLSRLGSLEAIRLASVEALIAAGASAKQAAAIHAALHRDTAPTRADEEGLQHHDDDPAAALARALSREGEGDGEGDDGDEDASVDHAFDTLDDQDP
ncbi:MAG: excinuclease ABC subunit UvrC [Myxococcales bacterium]|nr:excinuclease ABC subunit UvrC [Myxococcales bacterium]